MIDDTGNEKQAEFEFVPIWRICDHMGCPQYGELTTLTTCHLCGQKTLLLETEP